MTAGALTCVVALSLGALCAANRLPENACSVGGGLEVLSTPARLPATAALCNRVYDKQDFQQAPYVKYHAARPGNTYTLFMIDPDAPDTPRGVYYLHWILANIPADDFQSGNLSNSTELIAYTGPAPPEGTGLHRYMFFVYRHSPSTGRLSNPVEESERGFFNVNAYLREAAHMGVALKGPLAGVQFRSEFWLNTSV